MKFLCVPCDTPMKLIETKPPERGSISLVYSCPECAYEFAMLTNPYETQVVGSLGVKVGPQSAGAEQPAEAGASKCPFSGMVQEMTGTATAAGFHWTPEAAQRLSTIPEFVRPMAKTGIEKFAKEKGYDQITTELLDQAKDYFGM